jgi:hypothetical protein
MPAHSYVYQLRLSTNSNKLSDLLNALTEAGKCGVWLRNGSPLCFSL